MIFLKREKLFYLCITLSFLLSLLISIAILNGCGDGGGGGGADLQAELKDDIATKTLQILPDEAQAILENNLEGATTQELEDLNNAIDDFMDALDAHFEESLNLSEAVSINYSAIDDVAALFNNMFENVFYQGKRAFLNSGMGFKKELLGGAEGTLTIVGGVGGTFSIGGGAGIGTAYDFLNFSKYDYRKCYWAGSGGVSIGAEDPVPSASITGIVSETWMFGHKKDEQYTGGPSVGKSGSVGLSGGIIGGLGLSISLGTSRNLDGSCSISLSDCSSLTPSGNPTDKYGFTTAAKIKLTAGDVGANGNLSVGGSVSCSSPPIGAVHDFLEGVANPSALQINKAGFAMGKDLLLHHGVTGSTMGLAAAGTAVLYGILYDEDLIDEQAFGLVAYYPFDGDANDASGFGNDGAAIGGITYVGGISGQAASLNGQNTYFQIPDSPILNITGPITLATWIKADVDQYFRVGLISKGWKTHPFLGYHLRIADNPPNSGQSSAYLGLLYLDAGVSIGESGLVVGSNIIINDNQWHHIAATYDGTTMRMYIDGYLDNEEFYNEGYDSNNDPLLIGNFIYNYDDAHGNKPNILNGLMDEVRIYNRALSETEVLALAGGEGRQ